MQTHTAAVTVPTPTLEATLKCGKIVIPLTQAGKGRRSINFAGENRKADVQDAGHTGAPSPDGVTR